MTRTFYSDSGPRCMCGGTIYRYEVWGESTTRVDTYCYTCHAIVECAFFMDDDAARHVTDVSRAHRDA
jgi:hypothetical protein